MRDTAALGDVPGGAVLWVVGVGGVAAGLVGGGDGVEGEQTEMED